MARNKGEGDLGQSSLIKKKCNLGKDLAERGGAYDSGQRRNALSLPGDQIRRDCRIELTGNDRW